MTDDDSLELMVKQAREVADLRERQLRRDGRVWSPVLKAWFLSDSTTEPLSGRNDEPRTA